MQTVEGTLATRQAKVRNDTPAVAAVSRETTLAGVGTVSLRNQVPILTYHHIATNPSKSEYRVSVARFYADLKMLADSGYQTILPDDLYRYLTTGAPLPVKPVMLTFDDTRAEHYTIAAAALKQHQFKGVFFIMTISIGRPGYMTQQQIKILSDEGHVIGCHTWDHQNVTRLQAKDWPQQLDKPLQLLETITGKPATCFAYPYGAWNESAITALKKRHITLAFQLMGKQSTANPLYTVRRMMVPDNWSPVQLYKHMQVAFLDWGTMAGSNL